MIELQNKYLLLLISEPGDPYRGSRFDYTGQIIQITYLNKHTFCTTETLNESDINEKGRGMYNEFGIDMPVGYDECPVGGKFPKIGIGLLTRDSNEPYNFFKNYEVTPYTINYEIGSTGVKFICEVPDNHPYFFRYEKQIELQENTFKISYSLINLGKKHIITNEYVHNFLSINNRSIDESYRLSFAPSINLHKFAQIVNPQKTVHIDKKYITWNSAPDDQFFLSNTQTGYKTEVSWILTNSIDNVGIMEETDFIPQKINIWGAPHVVSPEIFYLVDAAPGGKSSWSRKYTIFSSK